MIERYSRPVMTAIWSDQAKYENWLKVEVAVCEAWAKEGRIPDEAVSVIKEKAGFDVILDEDWYVVLIENGEKRARFDPRDYTATELLTELGEILTKLRGDTKIAC